MADFILNITAIFGGVFGALVGFALIAVLMVFLGLPYIMMHRQTQKPKSRKSEELRDHI